MKRFYLYLICFFFAFTSLPIQSQGNEFFISTWFGIDSKRQDQQNYLGLYNMQKSKNFANLAAAGFTTLHGISSRLNSATSAYWNADACSTVSQEILDLAAAHGLQVELQHTYNIFSPSYTQRHLIEMELPLQLPPAFDYLDINEIAFDHRSGELITDGGEEVMWIKSDNASPGIIFSDARPADKLLNQWYPADINMAWNRPGGTYLNTYFLRCRLRIEANGAAGSAPALALRMVYLHDSTTAAEQVFTVDDFPGNGYTTLTVSADLIPMPVPPAETHSSAMDFEQGVTDYVWDVDYQVEWFGNVEVFIDKVIMEDGKAEDIFAGVHDASIKATAKTFNTHPGLAGFYLMDEPFLKQLLTFKQLSSVLREAALENGVDISGGKGLGRTAMQSDTRGKQYFVTNRLADPYGYYAGSQDYPAKHWFERQQQPNYTNRMQNWLGTETAVLYDEAAQTAKADGKPLWFFTQVHGVQNNETSSPRRDPYLSEVWMNANLALSYGAEGFHYFLYPTIIGSKASFFGLVEENTFDPVTSNQYAQNPWENVKTLNTYLKTLGPLMLELDWEESFCNSDIGGVGNCSWVSNNVLNSVTGADYIQVGLFSHPESGEDYFMLLNRMTREPTPDGSVTFDDTQTMTVELANQNGIRLVEDIYAARTPGNSDAFTLLEDGESSFSATIGPGRAKLFRITDGLHGDIPARQYYLSGEVYLSGDLTVPDGWQLVVENNTEVKVPRFSDVENTGLANYTEILVKNDAGLTVLPGAAFRPMSVSTPGETSWGGIKCKLSGDIPSPVNGVAIHNARFENARIAIDIQSNADAGRSYYLALNTMTDCGAGIRVLNYSGGNNLDIRDNNIQQCDIGIELQNSNGLVRDNTISDCEFGITCLESSNPIIRNNSISGLPSEAVQYGLFCVNNSAPVVAINTVKPQVSGGGNLFTGLDYGVSASGNAYPKMGQYTTDHSKDGQNMIYNNGVDVANDNNTSFLPIYAIYNYWDTEPGEPSPVLTGLVEYEPWLEPGGSSGGSAQSGSYGPEYDDYLAAYALEAAGNDAAAQTAYEDVIADYPDSPVVKAAISGLARSITTRGMAGQMPAILNNIITNESGTLAEDYARQHLIPYLTAQGEYQQAMQQSQTLLAIYDSTAFAPFILLDQLYILESQGGQSLAKAQAAFLEAEIAKTLPGLPDQGLKQFLKLKQQQFLSHEKNIAPAAFKLAKNYPNPFNPSTTIAYHLKETSRVRLDIYNVLGQKIQTLVNETQQAGAFSVQWNGRDSAGNPVASGIYIYQIQAGGFVANHKMMLLR